MRTAEKVLTEAGWRSAEDGTTPTPFDRFVSRLGFSLQGELLIQTPDGSSGFDFSTVNAGTEFELRRWLHELFLELFPSDICYAIDVNHGEWTFVPGELKLTLLYEPFPVYVTPWAEYAVFGNGDFSHGLFCNPWNRHVVVFGHPFVARFSSSYRDRLVPAEVAAGCRRVGNRTGEIQD